MIEQLLKKLVVHLPLQTVQGCARFFLWKRSLYIQLDPRATTRRWSLHRRDENPLGN
jgi:hypothetical protein